MVATVQVREKNTTAETATDKTSGNQKFKAVDDALTTYASPSEYVLRPGTGQNYSFEKWTRLHVAGTGPDNSISNLTVDYSSISLNTGIKMWVATIGAFDSVNGPTEPATANDPPFGPDDATGMTAIGTYTSGSPLDADAINTGPFNAPITNTDIGDYVVEVMEVESTAGSGDVGTAVRTFRWQEA